MKTTRKIDVLKRPDWRYTSARNTDIAQLFRRVRKEQEALKAEQQIKVSQLRKSK